MQDGWFLVIDHPDRGEVEQPITKDAAVSSLIEHGMATDMVTAEAMLATSYDDQEGIETPAGILMPPELQD